MSALLIYESLDCSDFNGLSLVGVSKKRLVIPDISKYRIISRVQSANTYHHSNWESVNDYLKRRYGKEDYYCVPSSQKYSSDKYTYEWNSDHKDESKGSSFSRNYNEMAIFMIEITSVFGNKQYVYYNHIDDAENFMKQLDLAVDKFYEKYPEMVKFIKGIE